MAEDYTAVCPREKTVVTFGGEQRITDTGRVLAEGICPDCGVGVATIVVSP